MSKIAIVQAPPAVLNKAATIARAIDSLAAAAAGGAQLVVFPETYIPGYPAWIWRLRPGDDRRIYRELYPRLLANAVDLEAGDLAPLQAAAAKHGVTIVVGFQERDAQFGRTTLYNALAVIGADGALINRHRKLMPTNPERMVWGVGDASGLRVVETPVGRLGALICWENLMPLSRYALYGEGVQVYCAPTYDSGDVWIASMQHIAREGGCFVISAGCVLRASDIPADFPDKAQHYPDPDEWINPGDSVVVAPSGRVIAGPMRKETGILFADLDLDAVGVARGALDVVGHYARPDIFQLNVNRRAAAPVSFED
ncbi:MAG: carbon-nitrogen hydrolase family protein [Caulobacterales bacterium]